MPFHCHPYLYTSWSVFPLFLSLFLGVRSLSSSTFYPYSRRAGISSRVVALTGVSRALDLTEPPQPPLLIFYILELFCLSTFSDDSNPLMNAVQLMVSEVLTFHENTEIFPSGDSYDISSGKIIPPRASHLSLMGYLS